jgi:hypothetical protein
VVVAFTLGCLFESPTAIEHQPHNGYSSQEVNPMHTVSNRTTRLIRSQSSSHGSTSTRLAARICLSLITIGIAIGGSPAGAALAARPPISAHAASNATITCDDTSGRPWTIPGAGEPSGDQYVVIAQNIPCGHAEMVATVFVNGGKPSHGWTCRFHNHFNGDCKHTVRRRRHRPVVQVVGWYPDFAHPNAP